MNGTIDPSILGGAPTQASSNAPQRQASDELGQEDFLRLMTAQLESQDPFKPMESGEFLGQFAQFGTVNGIKELQASFDGLSQSLTSLQALQASTLVGRTVTIDSDLGALTATGKVDGEVYADGANNVIVSVHDLSGALVRQEVLEPSPDGLVPFSWDGRNNNGELQPQGRYLLSAQGTIGGEPTALKTRVDVAVDSVTLSQGGAGLRLNLAGLDSIDAGAVLEIK